VWRPRRLRAVCARSARRSPGRATPLRVRHPAVAANPGLGGGVAPWSTPTPRATESVSEEKAPSLNAGCAPQPGNAERRETRAVVPSRAASPSSSSRGSTEAAGMRKCRAGF
ncbi:unnamed protein product, partial [Ixodes persulcatus]